MPRKLNQVIAVEKDSKARAYARITEFHKIAQKPELFNGFAKTYRPKAEDGEVYPPESKKVQFRVDEMLKEIAELYTEYYDLTASKDVTNCAASAPVIIDGKTIVPSVPATFLLTMEKSLTDFKTFISALPELSNDETWKQDGNDGLFYADPVDTHRTKKVQKPLVLYPATPEHPAQTQLITEDEIVGFWKQVKSSGSIAPTSKKKIVEKITTLLGAVKQAREEANMQDAQNKDVGKAIFGYLFGV
jgi:hypothetical protein